MPYAEHLVACFFEVGPAPGGNALTFSELRAWMECTGVELDEFEVTALSGMSRAYMGMLHEARNPNCPWPAKRPLTYQEEVAKAKRMRQRRSKGK